MLRGEFADAFAPGFHQSPALYRGALRYYSPSSHLLLLLKTLA